MSWTDRLREIRKRPSRELKKPTDPESVSCVSDQGKHSEKFDRRKLIDLCRSASGTLDPYQFTDWLIRQGDPEWMQPAALNRWAEVIKRRGKFP